MSSPMKLNVSNLSPNITDEILRQAFSGYGQVLDAIVVRDSDTGRTRGFGYVTFASQDEAEAALNVMNEQDLDGRRIRVNIASVES